MNKFIFTWNGDPQSFNSKLRQYIKLTYMAGSFHIPKEVWRCLEERALDFLT